MANGRAPRWLRFSGWFIKLLFTLLIFAVIGVVIWRMCSSGDPASMKALSVNDTVRTAYAENGNDLTLRYQNLDTITRAENNAGYYSVTSAVFIPEANQVQIVFRYNISTLRHMVEDYDLPEPLDRDLDWFDVSLVVTTDLTPDNPDDNETPGTFSETRVLPSSFTSASTKLYEYRRFVFDGVSVEPDTLAVFTDIFFLDDVNYETPAASRAYGTLPIYDCEKPWISSSLTSADRNALAGD